MGCGTAAAQYHYRRESERLARRRCSLSMSICSHTLPTLTIAYIWTQAIGRTFVFEWVNLMGTSVWGHAPVSDLIRFEGAMSSCRWTRTLPTGRLTASAWRERPLYTSAGRVVRLSWEVFML
eukprot:49281-Amphidinium_carterae.1